MTTKLNLGCGSALKEGYINADLCDGPGVDITFDAEREFPYSDNTFEEIFTSHVFEHLFTWHKTAIIECHRVLKPNGALIIRVPYGVSRNNPDANHLRFFWEGTMGVFTSPPVKGGLDAKDLNAMFRMESEIVERMFWCRWHFQHYLGISFFEKCKYRFPIGKKKDIIYTMRAAK